MDFTAFLDSALYTWVVLPLLIFFARILDVSLGTIRIIFISRNLKYYSAVIGFFEVLVWLLVIRQIMLNLSNPVCFIMYGAGFASGTFIGIFIENKLSIGRVIIRIITRKDAEELVEFLKSSGYGLTTIDAQGATGPVKLLFSIIERQDLENFLDIVKRFNPQAFYSVEDVRFVSERVTPFRMPASEKNIFERIWHWRKIK
ncbi:MAG: DUF2179 domain-containing protein [Desulfomonilia bacterium]